MVARVHLRSCASYDLEIVRTAVTEIVEHCEEAQSLLRPGATVLLKPNVVNPQPPETAVCTHPTVLRAIAEVVHAAGCHIILAEQPCYAMTKTADYALGVPGYVEALAGLPVEMHLLNSTGYDKVQVPAPFHLREVTISRLAREVDVIINLAKCKTHLQTQYTGAVKNMFGLLAPKQRLTAHAIGPGRGLARGVVDVFSACVPHLSFVDAVVGMEGHGPTAGTPRHIGFIAASVDAVALDAVVETTVGFKPGEIPTTYYAGQAGLGCNDLAQITVSGDDPADFRLRLKRVPIMHSRLPGFLPRIGRHLVWCRPFIDEPSCRACGGCKQVCPAEAIHLDGCAHINQHSCLECYCCIEACPYHAIKVSRSWLSRALSPKV